MKNDNSYFSVNAMNASTIKAGAKSMQHMRHVMDRPIKTTPAMLTGTHRHMALLEPDRFDESLVVWAGARRGKEYQELVEQHGEESIIKVNEYEDCIEAAEVVREHPYVSAKKLIDGGEAEAEYYWTEDGYGEAKAKLDYIVDGSHFVEFKTTENIDTFHRIAEGLHYDLGIAWYWRACGGLPGVFIVQERRAPYAVAVYEVAEYHMPYWWRKCLDIWRRYLDGDTSGPFPDPIMFEPKDHEVESIHFNS